jgi:hypothetical protein
MRLAFTRRRYLVDWKLQGSLCAHSLLYGSLVLAALFGGIYLPLLWDLNGERSHLLEEQAIVMLWMHERVWLLAPLCAAIVLASAIKLSHRIAGPLVRYKRNLRLLAGGKLPTPLRTRRGDYLKEEVVCLNAAVAGVAARVAAIARAETALRAELATLRANGAVDLGRLDTASEELARCVGAFVPFDPGDDRPAAAPAAAPAELAMVGGS